MWITKGMVNSYENMRRDEAPRVSTASVGFDCLPWQACAVATWRCFRT